MRPEQIATLAEAGESETLEFKATTGTRREAAATVCAMLNQRGGHEFLRDFVAGLQPNVRSV